MKKLLAMLLVLTVCVGLFAGCSGLDDTPLADGWNDRADYVSMDDYKSYLKNDLVVLHESMGDFLSTTVAAAVTAARTAGEAAIDAASDITTAKAAYDTAAENMCNAVPNADGVYNFSGLSSAEKTEILGQFEGYGIRNGMLGLTLFENGGYSLINPRVTLGSENYIVGYGFGILAEGSITADLDEEANAAWKRYYHTMESSDPGTIFYHNDQGSQVSDLYGYIGASYYTTFMNETKDGYVWVPELAAADPVSAVELDENGQSDTWKFEIRSGLKYDTNSTLEDRAAYKGREVEPEDFITAFKLLLNQANGLYRGTELANQTGAASIVGAQDYYKATKSAPAGIPSDDYDFSKVGVKLLKEDGKDYLQIQLGAPVTLYYARYYISSSSYMPIPASFVELVGVPNLFGFSTDKTTSPVDNSLSLGAYTLERWDSGKQIVFKKNPCYAHAATKYNIAGVHVNILTAAQEDKEATFREFMAGKLDSCGIPDTKLAEYSGDPRAKTSAGDSCFKMNINSLDQETWIKLFGVDGSYTQTAEKDYWTTNPVLSNVHFRQGLSYALNRKAFADLKGCIPSVSYFSGNYLSDPEQGISYNSTQEHKNAVASLVEGTDGYGYDLELARDYFRMALDELESDGLITPGTENNPTVIDLEIAWMYPVQKDSYHQYVEQYWTEAFNDASVSNGRYKIKFTFWTGADYIDCYNKMLTGQYDIGFGSISGNSLDPLSFFNVNSTDPSISNDFTLNWAMDTNTLCEALIYDGKRWSFDALYKATQELTIVSDGLLSKAYWLDDCTYSAKEDGSVDVVIKIANNPKVEALTLDGLVIFGGDSSAAYKEWELSSDWITSNYNSDDDVLTITVNVPKSEVDKVPAADNQGIDVYFVVTINGAESAAILSCYVPFGK